LDLGLEREKGKLQLEREARGVSEGLAETLVGLLFIGLV
jgi:hypothetical protein